MFVEEKKDLEQLFKIQEIPITELTEEEIEQAIIKWKNKFFKSRTAPYLDDYRWHIFSFNKDYGKEGQEAQELYYSMYPCDFLVFDEQGSFGYLAEKSKLLQIPIDEFHSDIYICHRNMKWTYVIPHESPQMGPYFCQILN